MERNIIATIKFSTQKIHFTVLEKLSSNTVEIFNDSTTSENVDQFLEKSLKNIQEIIGGKLETVSIVVTQSAANESKINTYQQSVKIINDFVSKEDVNNAIELSRKRFETSKKKVISVQPIIFDVVGEETKTYNDAPLNKKGKQLIVTTAITTILKTVYDKIEKITKSHKLKISQTLLSTQAITQNNLSDSALRSGAVLINIGEEQTFTTINRYGATVAILSYYDYGYKDFASIVSKKIGCSEIKARYFLDSYGSLEDNENNPIIFSRKDDKNKKIFYASDLNDIIKLIIGKMFIPIRKFIQQKNMNNLPIVISGKLNTTKKIDYVAKEYLNTANVYLYSTVSFVEMDEINIDCLGMSKFMERIDDAFGKRYDTIVKTNPNAISSLEATEKSKSWFVKVTNRIRRKYEWN